MECADFVKRHSAVIEQLDIVGHLTRAVRPLEAAEVETLKEACAAFGVAWRESYPHRKQMTVKGHIV